MVKPGDRSSEGGDAALAYSVQPLTSPEWGFQSIARSKTKRMGTPHPEKSRRALLHAGLEASSEVSRAKKKMAFEMAVCLAAKHHGEDKRSPENEQASIGEMLNSLAQMAKDGNVLTREMEGLDQEVVAGTTPVPARRNLDETRKELELVNHSANASTMTHVTCEGVVACDLQNGDKPKVTLHGQDNVGPFLVNANLNSNSATCDIPLSLDKDGCMRDRTLDVHPPEALPEKSPSPARTWKAARAFFPHGGTEAEEGTTATHNPGKAKPIPLDADKIKPMGAAGCHEGTPSLSFTDLETEFLSEKLGLAIVGKFSHSLPSTFQIQKGLGGLGIVGSFTWKFLNAKHILLQFQEMADYAKVLSGPSGSPTWFIGIHPMRVFKWAPDFDPYFESPIVAVWCNIMGIPAHLYEESALMAIGKLLGKPLQADHATINQTRLSFARICVEIDISTPPTEEIILNIFGKASRYKVAWDRIPTFCANCKHVGHIIDECHALSRKERVGGKVHRSSTKVVPSSHGPNNKRREWRPKADSWAGTSSNIEHPNKNIDGANQEKAKEGTRIVVLSAPREVNRSQPSVDEDGFQLVSRKRKGKGHEGVVPLKAQHIDTWHLKENVATVTFGIEKSGMNEPGFGSMSVECGPPNQEIEGFIEDLDPGGCIPSGGIPIAGLN